MKLVIVILLALISYSCKSHKASCDAYAKIETKKTIN